MADEIEKVEEGTETTPEVEEGTETTPEVEEADEGENAAE
jgi:hypothetical protein